MITQPNDFLMQAWKQQVDGSLRAIETLFEAANKLRELTLEAIADAHADLEATGKAMASANDPAHVFELQAQWARANAEKCAAYWRRFYEIGAQAQANLARCMLQAPAASAPTAAPAPAPGDSTHAAVTLIDQVYKQWLDTAQQLYKLPAGPGSPGSAASQARSKGGARTPG
jgi:phasin family protein